MDSLTKCRLILVVDRDNDLEIKANLKGPIIGERLVLEAAISLALADPSESDANAIFEGIRVYREQKNECGAEIALITGDVRVGTTSDTIIAKQLDEVIKTTQAGSVILVSDGAEDEYILPIIESRIKVDSISRLIVKQSEKLEGLFYLTASFFSRALKDPYLSKVLIGFPGFAAILLAIYGLSGWRIVAGVGGLALVIKGFHLEKYIEDYISDFIQSYKYGRFSFFTNLLSLIMISLSMAQGVNAVKGNITQDLLKSTVAFLDGGLWWFSTALVLVLLGRILDVFPNFKKIFTYSTSIIYVIVVAFIVSAATSLILNPQQGVQDLVSALAIGVSVVLAISIIQRSLRRRFILT